MEGLGEKQNSMFPLNWRRPFIECLFFYRTRGPFLERPGNLMGPESDFDIKVSRKIGRVLTSDEIHFVSLADITLLYNFQTF